MFIIWQILEKINWIDLIFVTWGAWCNPTHNYWICVKFYYKENYKQHFLLDISKEINGHVETTQGYVYNPLLRQYPYRTVSITHALVRKLKIKLFPLQYKTKKWAEKKVEKSESLKHYTSRVFIRSLYFILYFFLSRLLYLSRPQYVFGVRLPSYGSSTE